VNQDNEFLVISSSANFGNQFFIKISDVLSCKRILINRKDIMDFFEAVMKRRSIRSYTGETIPVADLEKIVDAGRLAPSGSNRQPWHFIVVTDQDKILQLSKAGAWSADASAMIAVVLDPSTSYWVEDGSAAIENILLAATALGYGACWLQGNAQPHEEEFKQLLHVPVQFKLLSLVPIGVPAEKSTPKAKKPLNEVLHWEVF
jgi:nitroreductase